MARKLPGFQRVLDAPALFSVAYGEIASSLYFALGIVALHALGLTPAVLLAAGLVFFVVALSYAEGTAAIPETGGAATFVRRGFNDLLGFVTGWALFLDYLIVIALSTLFLPHYLAAALSAPSLRESPWDVVVSVGVIVGIALLGLVRGTQIPWAGLVVAGLDLATQLMLVGLGFAFLFEPGLLSHGIALGDTPDWDELAFALPLALLAFTGLETVANMAEEAREPGRTLPRSLFSAIGLVVAITVAIAVVGLAAFPAENGSTALGDQWLRAPLSGIVAALQGSLPNGVGDALRVYVGLTGALVLLTATTTSVSGFARLAHSLGEHGQLPRAFGRLNRRTLVSPWAILAATGISIALVVGNDVLRDDVDGLASLYSFGVLLAFTLAQLAVIRLRFREPALERPFRVGLGVRVGRAVVPLPAVAGAIATFGIWIVALVTHPGARYAGPAWLVLGLGVYLAVRLRARRGLLEDVVPARRPLDEATYSRILAPLKLGQIGEEMVATAVALAKERGAALEALYVVAVPLALPLDASLPEQEERAFASLEEARLLGEEHGVEVETATVHARSIGHAIVERARESGVDLIVLGSSPRWRRQSAFFSPTVEHVLRHAPCEVLVVAFPQGVLEDA